MITIVVASIILALAVPSFGQFAANSRMTGLANEILVATHAARTEAIKRHVQTVFCFSSDPFAATPQCDGNATQGWIVFVDDADPLVASAEDNNVEVDDDEPVLLRHGPMHESIEVRSNPAANAGYVAYSPAGFMRELGAVGAVIRSLVLCDDRGNQDLYGPAQSTARGFTISDTGRPSTTRVVADINTLGGCP